MRMSLEQQRHKIDAGATMTMQQSASYPARFSKQIGAGHKYVTPEHSLYQELVRASYEGLVYDKSSAMTAELHTTAGAGFAGLQKHHLFQHDITNQLGLGKPCNRTMVKRTLVGNAGLTYKYLGIRMFAHPWPMSAPEASHELQRALYGIKQLNDALQQRAETIGPNTGSSEFNMTLINEMFSADAKTNMKKEAQYRLGLTALAWHADTCLEHFSTIGVYQQMQSKGGSKRKRDWKDWKVAMRVLLSPCRGQVRDAEGPGRLAKAELRRAGQSSDVHNDTVTPPCVMPMYDREAYYMFGDFNHHHQHAVIAGTEARISSTHRVGCTEGNEFDALDTLCQAACHASLEMDSDAIEQSFGLWMQVEFEWIRQFYIQGGLHYELHQWWQPKMAMLVAHWKQLQCQLASVIQQLGAHMQAHAQHPLPKEQSAVLMEVCQVVHRALLEIVRLRKGWTQRASDPAYQTLPFNHRPLKLPLTFHAVLPFDLGNVATQLHDWVVAFATESSKPPRETGYEVGDTISVWWEHIGGGADWYKARVVDVRAAKVRRMRRCILSPRRYLLEFSDGTNQLWTRLAHRPNHKADLH